jgi:6,7-dimethyl-8-ribityllumazine synthase
MSTQAPSAVNGQIPADANIAIVAARFNGKIVDELLAGCLSRLEQLGVARQQIEVHRVPGAFELPLAAQQLARTGRFVGAVCLGAVVRGETPHFDYVAGQCARGIAAVSLAENFPVIFGVLTTNTEQQAWDRCGGKHGHAGQRAAEAVVEMVGFMKGANLVTQRNSADSGNKSTRS